MAKAEGTITKVTPTLIEVTDKDGKVRAVGLGRRYGNVAGLTIPHELVTHRKVGEKVKPGDALAYNKHFFEPDALDKNQVLWKQGVWLNTVLMEIPETLEDSSAISERAAMLLETDMTEVRDVVVRFDQTVHEVLRPGVEVGVDSILCTIEEPITATGNLFGDESLDSLRHLAMDSSKAKVAGRLEKVEVFYNGDLDDLSPSLHELAVESDMARKRRARELNEPYTSGNTASMRLGGTPLLNDQAVIRFSITLPVSMGIGDKAVFANQMKTIIGRVLSGRHETEDGQVIDAIFSGHSIDSRIVRSPQLIATTVRLCQHFGQQAVAAYDGK